jgi:multidrug efflux pump subunit AcrA (membrane-fusion protein)
MQRAKIVLIVLTMMLICAVLAIGQPPPAKVVVAKVYEKEIVRTNQMVGIVDFDKQSGISTEVSGLIEQVSIVEGTV